MGSISPKPRRWASRYSLRFFAEPVGQVDLGKYGLRGRIPVRSYPLRNPISTHQSHLSDGFLLFSESLHESLPSAATNHLFVYGTLRRSGRHEMAGYLAAHAHFVGTGKAPGRLYQVASFP